MNYSAKLISVYIAICFKIFEKDPQNDKKIKSIRSHLYQLYETFLILLPYRVMYYTIFQKCLRQQLFQFDWNYCIKELKNFRIMKPSYLFDSLVQRAKGFNWQGVVTSFTPENSHHHSVLLASVSSARCVTCQGPGSATNVPSALIVRMQASRLDEEELRVSNFRAVRFPWRAWDCDKKRDGTTRCIVSYFFFFAWKLLFFALYGKK